MSLTLFPVVGVNPKQYNKLVDDSFVAIQGATAIHSESMLLAVERDEEYYRILFIDTSNNRSVTTSSLKSDCNVECTWCHGSEVELIKFPAFYTVNDSLDPGIQVTVRKSASTESAAITTLTPGSIILVHSVVDNWMQMSLGVPPDANSVHSSSAPKLELFWMRRSTDCGILLLLPVIPKCFRRSVGVPLDAALRRRMLPFPNAASIDPPFIGEHVLGVKLPKFPKWLWVVEGFWMMTAMDREDDVPLIMLEEVPHPTGDGQLPHQLKYVTTLPSVYAGATLRIRAHLPNPDVVETAAMVDEVGYFNDREVLCCATLRGKSYAESEINMRASWLFLATGALYVGEEGFCAMNMKNKTGSGDNLYNPLLSIININGIQHRSKTNTQPKRADSIHDRSLDAVARTSTSLSISAQGATASHEKETSVLQKAKTNSFDEAPIKPMKAGAGTDAGAGATSNPYDEAPIKPMKAGAGADAGATSNPYDEAPIKPMEAGAGAGATSNPYDEAPIKPMKAGRGAGATSNPYDEAPIKPMKTGAGAGATSNSYDDSGTNELTARAVAPSSGRRSSSLLKSSATASAHARPAVSKQQQQITVVEELDLGDSNTKNQLPIKKGSIAGKPWANADRGTGTGTGLANKYKSERIASCGDEGVPGRDREESDAEDGSKGLVQSDYGTNNNSRTGTVRTASAVSVSKVSVSKREAVPVEVDGISNEGEGEGAAPVALALECPEQVSIHRVVSTSTMSSLDSGMRQNASSGSGLGRDQREVSPLASPASRVRLSLSLGALSLCCGESTVDESAYSSSRYPNAHAQAHAVTSAATATSTVYASASPLKGGKEKEMLSGKSSPCPNTVASHTPSGSRSGFDSPVSFEAARNHFTKHQIKLHESEGGDRSDGGTGGGGGGGGSKASSPHRDRDRGRGNSVVINGSIISLLEKFNGSGNRRHSDEKSTERRPLFDLGEVSANRTLPSVVKKTRVLATSCSPTRNSSVADTTTNHHLSSHNNNNNNNMVDNNMMIVDSSEISSVASASVSSSVFVSASDGSVSHPSKLYGTVVTTVLLYDSVEKAFELFKHRLTSTSPPLLQLLLPHLLFIFYFYFYFNFISSSTSSSSTSLILILLLLLLYFV